MPTEAFQTEDKRGIYALEKKTEKKQCTFDIKRKYTVIFIRY